MNFPMPFLNEHLCPRKKVRTKLHGHPLSSFGEDTVQLDKSSLRGQDHETD